MIFLENRIPILILSITNDCNLNCKYCFENISKENPSNLEVKDWKDAYNIYKPLVIQFSGGEPTLRWNDILEFMDYIYKENKISEKYPTKIHICTNGTTGVDFETIPKEYRKYINIIFSLDGFEEINDKYRGKGNYEKTYSSIKRSIDNSVCTSINCTMSAQDYLNNLDLISNFIKHFFSIGIKFIRLNTIFCQDEIKYTSKAISALKELDVVKKYNIEVVDRTKHCQMTSIHIHPNKQLSPKCTAFKYSCGYFNNLNFDDVIAINKYCDNHKLNCKSSSYEQLDRFVKGLLIKKG